MVIDSGVYAVQPVIMRRELPAQKRLGRRTGPVPSGSSAYAQLARARALTRSSHRSSTCSQPTLRRT
jgi:hypothetical protein